MPYERRPLPRQSRTVEAAVVLLAAVIRPFPIHVSSWFWTRLSGSSLLFHEYKYNQTKMLMNAHMNGLTCTYLGAEIAPAMGLLRWTVGQKVLYRGLGGSPKVHTDMNFKIWHLGHKMSELFSCKVKSSLQTAGCKGAADGFAGQQLGTGSASTRRWLPVWGLWYTDIDTCMILQLVCDFGYVDFPIGKRKTIDSSRSFHKSRLVSLEGKIRFGHWKQQPNGHGGQASQCVDALMKRSSDWKGATLFRDRNLKYPWIRLEKNPHFWSPATPSPHGQFVAGWIPTKSRFTPQSWMEPGWWSRGS